MKPLRIFVCLGAAALGLTIGCSRPANQVGGQKYGNYTLFDTKYDQVDQAKARANADDVLTQLQGQDNICMIGLWAYNPPAILEAVQAARQQGKVHIVGFDENEITLKGVKDGHIHATVVQQPYEFGYQAVQAMYRLAIDPKSAPPSQVDKDGYWWIDHKVIRKGDVDAFEADLKKKKAAGEAAAPPSGKNPVKVLFVSNNAAEFWSIAQAGAHAAAMDINKANPDRGVEVVFKKPAGGTAEEQKTIIDDQLGTGVQAIALSVNDAANQTDYINKLADKVPVICVDNDAPNSKRRFYMGTNNVAAGNEVGKLVKEVLPGGGTIAIFVGKQDAPNARERRQGVLDELAGEKNAQGK